MLLKKWWYEKVILSDPYYINLFYAINTLSTVCIIGLIYFLTHQKLLLWAIVGGYFTALVHVGVGYIAKLKRSLWCGFLCLIAIFIGSLIGWNPWVYSIGLFVAGTIVFSLHHKGMEGFMPYLMPLFAFIIASSHHATLNESIARVGYAIFGVIIALIICNSIRPYNTARAVEAIKKSLLFSHEQYFKLVFMLSIAGAQHESTLNKVRDIIIMKNFLLNKNLRYLSSNLADQKAKPYYTLFSEGYLLARLITELSITGNYAEIKKVGALEYSINVAFENLHGSVPLAKKNKAKEILLMSKDDSPCLERIKRIVAGIVRTLEGLA